MDSLGLLLVDSIMDGLKINSQCLNPRVFHNLPTFNNSNTNPNGGSRAGGNQVSNQQPPLRRAFADLEFPILMPPAA